MLSFQFFSHPRFPYWALKMKQRHQRLLQANIYLRQHPADAKIAIYDLKEMVNSMSASQMVDVNREYELEVRINIDLSGCKNCLLYLNKKVAHLFL